MDSRASARAATRHVHCEAGLQQRHPAASPAPQVDPKRGGDRPGQISERISEGDQTAAVLRPDVDVILQHPCTKTSLFLNVCYVCSSRACLGKNDRVLSIKWPFEKAFLRTGVDRYALEQIVQRVRHDRLARAPRYPCRTVCLFVDFSYVRPEPVLANVRLLVSSGIGHRCFRTEGEHCRGLQHAAE